MNRRLALFLVVFTCASVSPLATCVGQDEAKQQATGDSQMGDADAAQARQPDEMPGLESAPNTQMPETGVSPAPKQQGAPEKSYLTWMIESSGPIGFVLFAMSFLAVGLTIKFVIEMQRNKVIPP